MSGLQIWQDCWSQPRINDGELEHEIKGKVGHYESQTGSVYYAVVNYGCSTWELEEDICSSCYLLI